MTLTYTLRLDEVLAACKQRSALLQKRALTSSWIRAMPWLALVLFVFAMLQMWTTYHSYRDLLAGDIALIVILLAAAMVVERRYVHMATGRLFALLAQDICSSTGEQQFEIGDDGLSVRTATWEWRYDRSAIDHVVLNRKTLLLQVVMKSATFILIPRRAFESDEQQRELYDQLRTPLPTSPRPPDGHP